MTQFDVDDTTESRLEPGCHSHADTTWIDSLWVLDNFHFLSMITNRVKNIDAMLKIPTSCGCFVDNEKHGRDVDATVLSIGLPMCITHKPCSYVCWCIHCLCHLHDLVTGDVKRKEGWLELSPITEGCASEELFFLSRTPYLDRNRCDAFLIMLESPLILYERCLFNDDLLIADGIFQCVENTTWKYII